MSKRETSAEIDAVAAEWAVRTDHAPLGPEEEAALDAWMAEDVRHFGAYARACAVLAQARRAKALGPGFDSAADAISTLPEEAPAVSRRRALMIGGSAAAAAAVGFAGGLAWLGWGETVQTRRGEIRLVPLADGSTMTLNTASRVEIAYDDSRRLVRLIEGEALFDVAKDKARPFVVEAGHTSVRALGTSFTVRRTEGQSVKVLVREGVVAVSGPAVRAQVPVQLPANTKAELAPAALEPVRTASVSPAEVTRALAWREGMLAFEDLPLEQAVAEFARYSNTRITIADPAVAQETITGLFAANNPAGFAQAAATSLGLRVDEHPGEIRLAR